MLLRAGADVNITGGGSTALMWAAQKGHAEVVRMLLEAGANVNRKDKDVKLALVHAREKKCLRKRKRSEGRDKSQE